MPPGSDECDNMMEDGDTEETLQDSDLRLGEEDEIKEELESEEINNDESVICEICPHAIVLWNIHQ